MTLEQALDRWRHNAEVLRETGHAHDADLIDSVLAEMTEAGEDYLTWICEDEAIQMSGESQSWFRRRHKLWEAQGLAKRDRQTRYYRQLIVPQPDTLGEARRLGREATA